MRSSIIVITPKHHLKWSSDDVDGSTIAVSLCVLCGTMELILPASRDKYSDLFVIVALRLCACDVECKGIT